MQGIQARQEKQCRGGSAGRGLTLLPYLSCLIGPEAFGRIVHPSNLSVDGALGLSMKPRHDTGDPGQAGEADAEKDQEEEASRGQIRALAASSLRTQCHT